MKIFFILLLNISSLLSIRDSFAQLKFDNTQWSYDSENKVYYQIGLIYCTNPATTEYNTLGIIVPENYLSCLPSHTKSYTCNINSNGSFGKYTSETAPIVIPVSTPGYAAQKSPQYYSYSQYKDYLTKGYIYVHAGCRGRYEGENYNSGAPWGVTDLKAAIRYIRYNNNLIPGDKNSIFSFGHSGGGAQSCLLGITGDSGLFKEYLDNIGAFMEDEKGNNISDKIKGSQCWCPITNLDSADMAYEWNMGQYFTTDTRKERTFTKKLSIDLAKQYVSYINNLTLKDELGNILTLDQIDKNKGTYYDYLKSVIETSLNNFLSDTYFPYTPEILPPFPGNIRIEKTYDNPTEYINYLNKKEEWIKYDKKKNTASITSVEAFVKYIKNPTKKVGAFDDLNKTQAENLVFGFNSDHNACHFDTYMRDLLKSNDYIYKELDGYDPSYKDSYSNDIELLDALGKSVTERVNIYNPMYYISSYYNGYKSSNVADYFRINTGIAQGDTSNCVEMNLALALKNFGKNVEFTTVWGQGHVLAERGGSDKSTANFISWVNKCMGKSDDNDDSNKNNNSPFIKSLFKYYIILLGLLL